MANPILIYCDGSYDNETEVGSWGCVIHVNGKIQTFTDTCGNAKGSIDCELYAAVKSMGKVKAFGKRRKILYTDCFEVYECANNHQFKNQVMERNKLTPFAKSLVAILRKICKEQNVVVEKIKSADNPAHQLAYEKLCELREMEETEKPSTSE